MKTTLGNRTLFSPIMNAAGTCKYEAEIRKLLDLEDIGAIVIGSVTMNERAGNSGNTFYSGDGFTLNALGLKNPGIEYYSSFLPDLIKEAEERKKIIIMSVAGFSAKEYATLTKKAFLLGVHMVEENWGCPNIWIDGQQKEPASFDMTYAGEIIRELQQIPRLSNQFIGIKISPMIKNWRVPKLIMKHGVVDVGTVRKNFSVDEKELYKLISLINKSKMITFVTSCNTVPNCCGTDENGQQVLSNNNGLGGLAGGLLKKTSLYQLDLLTRWCDPRLHLLGAGGIETGNDMNTFLEMDIRGVQIGSAFYKTENTAIFPEILAGTGD